MQELNNKNQLLDLLAGGATVFTPNNRLSGALLQEYFSFCQTRTVSKPACYPYSTALIKTFNQLKYQAPNHPYPILLNDAQCQHLWRTIIKSDSGITYSEGLLRSVMQAWEHCEQWQISTEDQAFSYTPQTRTFQQWWQLFNKKLNKIKAINEHQLVPFLINNDESVLPQSAVWVCFDDFSPQQIMLQKHWESKGLIQYRYDLKDNPILPRVCTAKDNKEEYQQLISWLKLKIEQGEQRIGVVVPNLEQESRSLQRTFLHHFDHELFNISLGEPLSEFLLVAHALNWLNLSNNNLDPVQAALLLQSPYLGSAKEEYSGRSQLLQDSMLLQKQRISLRALIKETHQYAPKLSTLLDSIIPYPEFATPQEWVELFQNRLNALGFPGDTGLNSENYQCFNRFASLFDEFRQLSLLSKNLTNKEAIDAFTQLANNTIFQAQKTNAPIHISGMLEASGCEFDSLWVMGLNDQCLPKKPRLSAFIPPQMQRDLLMPHSHPNRELLFAKQTLQRMERGSVDTVFSYSKMQGDTPNLPCSLILHYPSYQSVSPSAQPLIKTSLVSYDDLYTIPLLCDEKISGGTALLANQAKCPFKAFAEHRLKAKPVLQTTDGLDAKEKGIIIHKIMELFWRTIGSQKQLLSLNSQVLEQHVEQAIRSALSNTIQNHADSFPELIQEVELVRLKRLVLSFLEWEKQRPEFEIAALEESYSINLAGLDFSVRVDRLDRVEGSKWVIDYKSSLPVSKPWNEDRPTEPQLLLYTLLDKEINTLLLMQLKTGTLLCSGLSENKLDIKGINTLKKEESWELRRNEWQQHLTNLAEELQQGHCPPQPASAALCGYCDFQNLCRYRVVQESGNYD
ncbi:PD-(D/E)XK nuclease family protein [uncultured Legionella sp.]|uniref:PD-(D/E)XK nuclease family protein n=1 Tax=uncultured Legionella sp. TaxID=210934 RepID=UPI00261529A8|nr:PD-(D/E)XK nuclease family protein [uncultured Legionella sp.]